RLPVTLRQCLPSAPRWIPVATLMADDDHTAVRDLAKPAHNRGIVAIQPVAMQLNELRADAPNVVEGRGTLGVSRDLNDIPGTLGTGAGLGHHGSLIALDHPALADDAEDRRDRVA